MEPRKELGETLRLNPPYSAACRGSKPWHVPAWFLSTLFVEPVARKDLVEVPAKAGPEKEKGIAPPPGAPSSNSAG